VLEDIINIYNRHILEGGIRGAMVPKEPKLCMGSAVLYITVYNRKEFDIETRHPPFHPLQKEQISC
jgi:hypothetical protein